MLETQFSSLIVDIAHTSYPDQVLGGQLRSQDYGQRYLPDCCQYVNRIVGFQRMGSLVQRVFGKEYRDLPDFVVE